MRFAHYILTVLHLSGAREGESCMRAGAEAGGRGECCHSHECTGKMKPKAVQARCLINHSLQFYSASMSETRAGESKEQQ